MHIYTEITKSQQIYIHQNEVAQASPHHKEVEDLMASEIFRKPLKYLELKTVQNSAQGVDDSSRQQPEKSFLWKRGKERFHDKNAGPSHGNIDHRAHPMGTVDEPDL